MVYNTYTFTFSLLNVGTVAEERRRPSYVYILIDD